MKRSELREKASIIKIGNSSYSLLRCVLTFDEAQAFMEEDEGAWAMGAGCAGWHGESMSDFESHFSLGMEPMEGIQELVSEVESLLDLETLGPSWEQDIMGGSPNVPAYLIGSPLSMNRWVDESEENRSGLVRVICDASSSCSISGKSLSNRAKAVTALVRTLSMFRPVEFWLASCGAPGYQDKDMMKETYGYTGGRDVDTACMVKISSAPVDMGMVTLAMSQAFCRRFMYGVEYNLVSEDRSGSLGWPTNNVKDCVSLNSDTAYMSAFDMIIPPLHANESENFGKGAAKWVYEQTVAALEGSGAAHTVYNNEGITV